MRILIDFTQIPIERTGVGVYAEHLLQELPDLLDARDRLFVLIQDDERFVPQALGPRSQVQLLKIPSRIFRNRAALLVFEQLVLPCLAWRHRIDVLHSLHYTHPLFAPCARAVTIHDMTFSLFPELHTRGRRLLFPFFIRRALRRAECPIYVSHSTQRDAERLFGPSRHPGHVTPLGVDPAPAATNPEEDEARLASLCVRKPFLLFLGTIEPRKNVVRILQAFEQVAADHPSLTLVLAGKMGWHPEEVVAALEKCTVRGRVCRIGFVSEAEKSALLRSCAALVYPSLYEGFGLPVLEAMAHGAPVITSNLSSMPEVAGDAAIELDPHSVKAIAQAIDRIASDKPLREDLHHRGTSRSSQFTWKRTAKETYASYTEAYLQ